VTGTRAVEIARRLGDVRLRVLGTTSLEQVHYFRGEYSRVVELVIDNLGAMPSSEWVHGHLMDAAPPPIHDRFWLLLSLGQLGRFAEATEYESEALRLAMSMDSPYGVGLTLQAAGAHHIAKGDWIRARSLIERGVAVARAENLASVLSLVVTHSAWILAQLGEAGEALDRLQEGERLLEGQAARGFGVLAGTCYTLGRACLLLGRLDEAQRLGDRAVESSPRQPGYKAHAVHLLGDIATHPARFDAKSGEVHYRQALALAERCDMRPLVAHCHFGLGKLHRRTGRQEKARGCLATATAMYHTMCMTYWLEQAEAEMRRNVAKRGIGRASRG
jgi:tetratricopeptide (TPR) repeat protein